MRRARLAIRRGVANYPLVTFIESVVQENAVFAPKSKVVKIRQLAAVQTILHLGLPHYVVWPDLRRIHHGNERLHRFYNRG